MFTKTLTALTGALLLTLTAFAQVSTNHEALSRMSAQVVIRENQEREEVAELARKKNWPMELQGRNGNKAILTSVDEFGYPVYTSTENNLISAATTGANILWNSTTGGLNLNGSAAAVSGKMGVWDGGAVRGTHSEFTGRILQKDNAATSDHATHVAGTMIAGGANSSAKGMAYGLTQLIAYWFDNHMSEMTNEASNLLVSNHSYGTISGWFYNDGQNRWEFRGRFGENEDWKFGNYNTEARDWDAMAYNAPNYLIVKSAGNNRDANGPNVGQPYWRYDASGNMVNAGGRPSGISNNDGFDIISTTGTAKNILTVGAISGIAAGYKGVSDVNMSGFSSWGPTDDGRIKPDIVANGVDVMSPTATSDNSYSVYSGTSMASPNASGSLLLLQEYWHRINGAFMRSATLKGIAIHTASEAGDYAGPDYKYGWGVLNVGSGAALIGNATGGNTKALIQQNTLNNTATYTQTVVATGDGPLKVTVAWTDPAASVEPGNLLNSTTPRLVNDLDVRVKKGATTYVPWKMNPALPANPATKGDNNLDNVEQVIVDDVIPGQSYTIEVTHKGTLTNNSQAFSVIASGVGGAAYCASGASATDGARIDSVSFSNVKRKNPAGCTTFADNTNLTADIQPGQTVPLYISVGSCDATTASKVVKAYIDFNMNGNFTDAGEEIAASSVISTTSGVLNTNVVIPGTITVGSSYRMRVVLQETATAGSVTPCGAYTKGETQDFRVYVKPPASDMEIAAILSPMNGDCANPNQLIAVNVRNNGSSTKVSYPVTVTVKNGSTVISSMTNLFNIALGPNGSSTMNFQGPFNMQGGNTYTITAAVNDAGDQLSANNTFTATIAVPSNAAPAGATASLCGPTMNFTVTPNNPALTYVWLNNNIPVYFGTGSSSQTSPPASYQVQTGWRGNLGITDKGLYPGSYNTGGFFMKYTSTTPLKLESSRFYIGTPGKITVSVITNITQVGQSFSYVPVSSKTFDVFATTPTGQAADDTGHVFQLDVDLPSGNNAIYITASGGATIFRNNGVTGATYPMSTPGNLFSLTGHSNNTPTPDNFYYYLYDMKLKTNSCVSQPATVTTLIQPASVISLAGNVLSSSITGGVTFQWYKDNVSIAGATQNTYTATLSGAYRVNVRYPSSCELPSNTISHTITSLPTVDPSEIGMIASPNPSTGRFELTFNVSQRSDLMVEILNAAGQSVYSEERTRFAGIYSKTINIPGAANGVYILRVIHNGQQYNKKLLVVK